MKSTKVLGVAFLLASISVNATESGVFAPNITSPALSIPKGTISLNMTPNTATSKNSYFRYIAEDGTLKWNQDFASVGYCGYSVVTGNFVALSATGGSVGYRQGFGGYGLGVNFGGKEGPFGCTNINPGESLAFDFRAGLGSNYLDFASLELEMKYAPLVTIKLYKDTNEATPTNLVYTYTYTLTCTSLAECGDSNSNDERLIRVPIAPATVAFNRMVVSAAGTVTRAAAVTIEGGDDLGTFASTFDVVTVGTPVICKTPISNNFGGTGTTITFFNPAGSTCPNKGYYLTGSTRRIDLLTGGPDNSLISSIVTTIWAPEPFSLGAPVPLSIVFPPLNGEAEVWCNGTPDFPMMPDGHTWCRITQSTQIVGGGFMQVTETSLLNGDSTIVRLPGGG